MNKKYIITVVLVISVLFGACKSWLNEKPSDGITINDFWKTKEQVNQAVVGCYSSMLSSSFLSTLFYWGEVRGDLVVPNTAPTDAWNFWEFQLTSLNKYCDWSPVYATINNCNLVLQFAPGAQTTDPTFTNNTLKAYEAEALGIRALMYFYLVRTFGDVPLRLTPTYSDDGSFAIRKTGQDTILAKIVTDLDTAEKYIPTSYSTTAETKGRITKYAIWAMQAEVNLWLGDASSPAHFDTCINECNKIINSQKFGLVSQGVDGTGWFNTIFAQGNSNESIFELQCGPQALNPWVNMLSLTLSTSGRNFKASPDLLNLFPADQNIQDNPPIVDARGAGATYSAVNNSIWKWIGINPTTERTAAQSYANWIFYRLADVYLMEAEALAQKGDANSLAQSLSIVNLIRTRATAVDDPLNQPSTGNTQGLTNYVLQERARELAFEGKRWFDLLRVAKRNNYALLGDIIGVVVEKTPINLINSTISRLQDPRSLYLPIPQSEIDRSKGLLIQNSIYQ